MRVFEWQCLDHGPRAHTAGIDIKTGERVTIDYPADMTREELAADLEEWTHPDIWPEPGTIVVAPESGSDPRQQHLPSPLFERSVEAADFDHAAPETTGPGPTTTG